MKRNSLTKVRRLRLESLEQRQMLTASSVVGGVFDSVDGTAYVVDTSVDVVDDTDGVTSLREAVAAAGDGDKITFAENVNYVFLNESLTYFGEELLTLSGDDNVAIVRQGGESNMLVAGLMLDGVRMINEYGTMTVISCEFTGDYVADYADYNGFAVLENYGTLSMNNVKFAGINLAVVQEYGNEVPFSMGDDTRSVSTDLIYNDGRLSLVAVDLIENTLSSQTDRSDNALNATAILNDQNGLLYTDGVLIANNVASVSSNRGDMTVNFAGIANLGETAEMQDLMIYGNTVTLDALDERFADDVLENSEELVVAMFTSMRDITLENATILQGIMGIRGDYYLSNSIYLAEGNVLDRALIVDEADDCNFVVNDLADLVDIFPAFDAENGNFTNYDHRMYVNSAIVDAGNRTNDNLQTNLDPTIVGNENYIPGLAPNLFQEKDLEGNNRINGDKIDIGAVESNAEKLVVGNLEATPADGALGLSTVLFSWDAVENATGYNLQYKIGNGDWVLLENLSSETETLTRSGVPQGTECSFKIQAIGDNLSWIDSDWSDAASCMTKTQLQIPEDLEASLKTPNSIDVAWALNPEATGYTLQMRVKDSNDAWTTIDSTNFRLNTNIGASLQENLLYETTYEFRIKALGNGTTTIDSEWGTVEATTGVKLSAVNLMLLNRGTDSIQVTWDDTVNTNKPVKAYVVEYQAVGENEWHRATVTERQATASGLDEGTTYNFRLMVEGTGDTSLSSPWSDTLSTTTKQHVATPNVTAEATSSSTMDIEWEAVDNATGYHLLVKQGNTVVYSNTLGGTVTGHTLSGLTPETLYDITLYATGSGDYVDSESSTTNGTTWIKLNAPTPNVTDRTTDAVTVAWNAIANSDGYEVQYKLTLDGAWQDLAQNTDLSATFTEDTDITDSQSIWFRVRAMGWDGVSETSNWSATLSNDTLEILVMDRGSLDAVATGAYTATVTWNAVTGAAGYTLSWTDGHSTNRATISKTLTQYAVSGLLSDTTYTFTIVANGDGVENVDSNPVSDTAKTWIQLLPPAINQMGRTESRVTGVVSTDDNASGYQVQYSTDKENWFNATMDGNEFTASNLQSGTLYYLRAMAKGIHGVSVDSDWGSQYAEIRTQGVLSVPEDFEVSVKGTTVIDVAWARVANAGKYVVEWQKDGDTTWSSREVSQSLENIVVCNFTGLTPDTKYHFKVKAISTNSEFVDSISTEVKSGRTNAIMQLASPVLSYISRTSDSSILSWNSVENAEGYVVFFREAGGTFSSLEVGTDTSLPVDDLNLRPNRTYEAYVVAVTSNPEFSNSNASNTVRFTQPKAQLAKPELTLSYTDNEQSILATWGSVRNATGYVVNYRTRGGSWVSQNVDAYTNTFTLSNLQENTTYEFRVDALGDADTNGASSDIESIATPVEVNLTAIVRKEATAEGTTRMPATEAWIDEWTNAYVEIWTNDTAGVINGRNFSFTLSIDPMYVVATEDVSGFSLTNLGDGLFRVTVNDFTAGTGDTMLARFALSVNNQNGVNWTDIGKSDAFVFDGEKVDTTVYAVPGDMDDNGVIEMGPDGNDTKKFDVEYGKTVSYADFDASDMVRNADRKWMIENNNGKSYAAVNAGLETITYPVGFPYDFAPVERIVAQSDAGSARSYRLAPVAAMDSALLEGTSRATQLAYAEIEANEIPVVVDANALSISLAAKDTQLAEATPNLVDEIFAALEEELDFFA